MNSQANFFIFWVYGFKFYGEINGGDLLIGLLSHLGGICKRKNVTERLPHTTRNQSKYKVNRFQYFFWLQNGQKWIEKPTTIAIGFFLNLRNHFLSLSFSISLFLSYYKYLVFIGFILSLDSWWKMAHIQRKILVVMYYSRKNAIITYIYYI